jgi:hypothetical protein
VANVASRARRAYVARMGCVIFGLTFLFPRAAFIVVLLGGNGYLDRAFPDGWLWPLLGFVLMPATTLAYAYGMNSLGEPGVMEPLGWVLVAIAVLLDLGAVAHRARTWRMNRREQKGDGDRQAQLPPLPPTKVAP